MTTFLTIIHIVVCFFLVVIVLLQHGKGADIGATFGGSSQSLFGTEGPVPLMNKITTLAAITFMVTSISLAYYSSNRGGGSVMSDFASPPPPVQSTEGVTEPIPMTVPLPAEAPEESAPAEFPGAETTDPEQSTAPSPEQEGGQQ